MSVPLSGVEHFDLQTSALGLFLRLLGATIGVALVIPAPWIVFLFSRWFVSQLRLDGQPSLSFGAAPTNIASLAIGVGRRTTSGSQNTRGRRAANCDSSAKVTRCFGEHSSTSCFAFPW